MSWWMVGWSCSRRKTRGGKLNPGGRLHTRHSVNTEPCMRLAVRGMPKGALRTQSAQQAPLWGSLVDCIEYCLRVRGQCFRALFLCFCELRVYVCKCNLLAGVSARVYTGRGGSWSVCMYVCKYFAAPAHARTGPRRHTRAPACHRHHIHPTARPQAGIPHRLYTDHHR